MHTLILGQSFTGKSALAKQLGTTLRSKGHMVIAFNPTLENGYTRKDAFDCIAADYETDNPDNLIREIHRLYAENTHKKIFVIIDEAHEFFTKGNCAHEWVGTKGRHYGLHVIAITQRAALINTTFRAQCSTIYAFRSNKTDMEFVKDEFWHYKLTPDKLNLPDGEYIKIGKGGVFFGNIHDW